MEFQILSHAGLLVRNSAGITLLCDPWLVGSSYWRSWWNYPPVSRELVNSIKADFIYLTHIHWDHFHGPSLENFTKDTTIIVPKGNYSRIKDDLNFLGFNNVLELRHGETLALDHDFKITSYQIWMFLDSALLIDCQDTKILNLNDSKHMGLTLKEIIQKHQPIDFVLRSHSSANERLSYDVIDAPHEDVDDMERYIKEFALTVAATGAKYAIPFASNHCHLHKDSYHFNKYIQHPKAVQGYFEQHQITSPKVRVMVSGDKWSSECGFIINEKDWFGNREMILDQYLKENTASLTKFYAEEDAVSISKEVIDGYFKELSRSIPFFIKYYFRSIKFTYVLSAAGKNKYKFNVDIGSGKVEEISNETQLNYTTYPIQIHTTAYIFLRAMEFRTFSHMCIGKRVFYKVTKSHKKYMEALNLVFNCYEYDLFPIKKMFTRRSAESWSMRWREVLLYFSFVKDKLLYNKIDIAKYLKPIVKKN